MTFLAFIAYIIYHDLFPMSSEEGVMKRTFLKAITVNFIVGLGIVFLFPQWSAAQWVQTPTPPAGVQALTATAGNVFAGSIGNGVYLTTNNGTSWTAVNTGLTNLTVYSLVVNGGNVFAGTNGGGVFLTTNNGTSWSAVNTGLTNLTVYSLVANGGNVFAGTAGGVFLTTNNGTSWSAVNTGLTNLTVYSLVANGGNVFTGTNGGGVYLTTNNGTSWARVSNGLTNGTVLSLGVNGGNIFAGTSGGGVFLTTNNGTSWTAVNTGLTNLNVTSLTSSGGYVFAGTSGGGVFLTTNNGTNWIEFNTGLTGGLPPVFALTASGSNLFAGLAASPGVWRRPLSDVGNLPAAPTLSSPANGATGVALSSTMAWNAVTGATSYRLQVSTTTTFSITSVNDSTQTGTSKAIGPLTGATIYYWRVRAKNAFGTGPWSLVRSFTTIWSPPAAPALVSPADSAIIHALSVTFSWNASSGAASYTLNVSSLPDFSILTVNQSGITSTSQLISGLSNNTAYYWRVNAVNPAGASPWSDTSGFSMAWDTTWKCIAYWSFDSTSGNTFYDVTGHGYDATGTGTGFGLVSGIAGQALNCSGSGYEITVANSSNDFYLPKFSIECWFYSNVNPSQNTSEGKILDYQYITLGTRNGYTVDMTPSGYIRFVLTNADGSAWVTAASSTIIQATTWYHIVCTYDSSFMKIYLNGVLDDSLAYQGTYAAPSNNAHIGYQERTTGENFYYLNGRIDELKLYNYALPADSINAHYLSTAIKPAKEIPALASSLHVQARNSQIKISLPSAMVGKAVDIAVYSASGRELVKKNLRSVPAQITLSANGLSYGVYFLAVKDGNRKITARFVVLR
jgi:hypothetical protein